MNLFFECPRCFWLRVNEKVERPSGPFPSLPSGIDEAVKEHFDRFRERDEVPPEIQRCSEDNLRLYEEQDFLENARKWQTEPKWNDDNTEALLRGGVDDLMRNSNDEIVVLDYKTRGYPPKEENGAPNYYTRQVNLYNLILRENGYETADYGLILYFYPDGFDNKGDFTFHTETRRVQVDIDQAKKMVRDAVDTLDSDIPAHDEECNYRDWKPDF
jgi:CRISPR/Cas system-associated exonuclease Cas4 (RecB family)